MAHTARNVPDSHLGGGLLWLWVDDIECWEYQSGPFHAFIGVEPKPDLAYQIKVFEYFGEHHEREVAQLKLSFSTSFSVEQLEIKAFELAATILDELSNESAV